MVDTPRRLAGRGHWVFNAWGGIQLTRETARSADRGRAWRHVPVVASAMVNEGGGICVDGEGTVIVTETVQLHGRRNPGWTKSEVEAELARTIGATTVIWLERGLMGDMQQYRPGLGTNGHVDVLAAFVRPGVVVVHGQPDPEHHDHAVMRENVATAASRPRRPGPRARDRHHRRTADTVVDGVSIDHSYINFSFVNDGIVMSVYGDDEADASARDDPEGLFPDRRIAAVDAEPIFRNGGGVHCITQQQPDLGPSRGERAEIEDSRARSPSGPDWWWRSRAGSTVRWETSPATGFWVPSSTSRWAGAAPVVVVFSRSVTRDRRCAACRG